jgi:N-acetylneuraminic acid mutarotase
MKKRQNNSRRATALHFPLAVTLISGLAALLGSIFNAPPLSDATTNKSQRLDAGEPRLFVKLSPTLPRAAQPKQLSVADRIAYQWAIEEVYWRHRIWPKENLLPKPSLDEVTSAAQIEQKVEDYLRNSQALEDYWQQPLTAGQLQVEMKRMAEHTRQPEVLRELFTALGNDPFVIAECLVKPALAQRFVTRLYGHDQRFHGELRRRAELDLRAHASVKEMKQSSGNYSEIELIRSDAAEVDSAPPGAREARSIRINSSQWQERGENLAAEFDTMNTARAKLREASRAELPATTGGDPWLRIKAGALSPLQEDERRYYATAVLKKTKDRVKLAVLEWRKESFESWKTKADIQIPDSSPAENADYMLPAVIDDANACAGDIWTATNTANAPANRQYHTAIWTGSEMIVWGGYNGSDLNTGARYTPGTDSWVATSTTNAPTARFFHTVVWTGGEMIVWGGGNAANTLFNTGGRYNPLTDSWTATGTTGAPGVRTRHTAVWTGNEMIIWGGHSNTGGRYNPSTNSWTATNTTGAPQSRYIHTAVWSGTEMIVWGGIADAGLIRVNNGGKYDPGTNSWTATSLTNVPASRSEHTALWTGSEMIVWGGYNGSTGFNTGGKYNPGTDSWTTTSTVTAPTARWSHSAVWIGTQMIVWGGFGGSALDTGGRYDPSGDSWTATSTTNAPAACYYQTAVWTGSEMIVWGGSNGSYLNTGGRYCAPVCTGDIWTATSITNAPVGRQKHTAVWTGSEMIVWGGYNGTDLNTGARYTPGTDSWLATSTTNAPTARGYHTAVWTGSEIIVWGGAAGGSTFFNTGGRYNPATDSWTATSTSSPPTARYAHTAVWTGSEMIVWGGYPCCLNTGGKYNPSTNSWTPTNTAGAAGSRGYHTAVWTGSEMIVWGGINGAALNTGGRYNPGTNSWILTSTTNVPAARTDHTAVWTGSEMIVWGGYTGSSGLNIGGRYNPGTDSWTSTSTTNAPSARWYHTAVGIGNEMIVWGGFSGSSNLNTGGRYNPGGDSWTATSTSNAPAVRYYHTAVWTGSEMIVWGGYNGSYLDSGGRYCAQPTPAPTPTPTPTPTPAPINISGTISYCFGNPTPGPVPNVTLTLTGSALGSTLSDASGNYQFSSLPSGGTYTVTPSKAAFPPGMPPPGITTVDVIAVQRHFLNFGTPLSGCRLAAADVNALNGVDTVDVIVIQRYVLQLTTGTANAGKYKFTPANRTYSGVVGNQTGQNYDALVFGDVAGSSVH